MSARRRGGQLATAGADLVQRRVASFAGMVAAAVGAVFALGGCAIAAILGNGPGLFTLVAIVGGVALGAYLVVRAVVSRINAPVLAAALARRIAARRSAR